MRTLAANPALGAAYGTQRDPALIVLEALLLGQQVKFRGGHTVEMVNGQLYIVAEQRYQGKVQEVLLHGGGLDSITELRRSAAALSPDDLFIIASQNAMIKMTNEKAEARRKYQAERQAQENGCNDCGGTGIGPTPRRGVPPSCKNCKGKGMVADDAC